MDSSGPGTIRNFTDDSPDKADGTTGFLAVCLSVILGVGMGFGFSFLEFELPFFLEELMLGTICAGATAYCLGKFLDMPDGLIYKRVGPAAGFGALVGLLLFGVWYGFDPSMGFPAIGGFAGFCAGLPVAASFGLFGGESRPIGFFEVTNVGFSAVIGMGIAFWFALEAEEFDFYFIFGLGSLFGLLPTMLGSRIHLGEFLQQFGD